MNPLLARQLRKHLPESLALPSDLDGFLKAVSDAYDEHEEEQRMLEHTLEVTSEELNEANERLRAESETKLRSLSEHYLHTLEFQQGMILRVLRADEGFMHTLCRGQLAVRIGWVPERVEGFSSARFASPATTELLNRAYEALWGRVGAEQELEFTEGGLVVLARLQFLEEAGRDAGLIISAVDITERTRSELALRAAKERAESADRAKSEFLAVMSHEIRTPLNAVLGFNSLLEGSALDDEQRAWVSTIHQSGRSLLSLLNDILDFSKIEAGQLHLAIQPCQLHLELSKVVSLYATQAEAKGVTLRCVLAPGLPEVIRTDAARLRQILVNLLSNAVKFTHQGMVSLAVSMECCDHTRDSDQAFSLRVDVTDTGIGIPEHLHARIFKPFSQADASSTREYGGTGLGLAISKRLAKALGGDLSFTSRQGTGSVFTLRIRTQEGFSCAQAVLRDAPADIPASLRVLVAEDHPHNRELLRRLLSRYGIDPALAPSGLDAVTLARSEAFDLIFMDVRMPGLDGLEATKIIRKEGRGKPRIVAVTANAFEEEKRMCFDAGMDSVILKPFAASDLLRELRVTAAVVS